IYRLTYPGANEHHDAEALLLDGDDNPIIITKDGTTANIFTPTKALVPDSQTGVPLKKVGFFKLSKTDTEGGPLPAGIGEAITGAAKSPDGKKVVLRSYTDAFEFTVGDDGDIVKAITSTDPVITRLPNEPQGEGIS